jgi:quercetin dioxygenase-like cupin family protein
VETGQTIEGPHMEMRLTCRDNAASSAGQALRFDLWIRADAPKMPMHVHPHQEERITVVSGRLRSRSGNVDRILSPGQTVITPPGEAHTIAPAGDGDVEVLAELRPALEYERFIERVFALDRAGRVSAKGRANPIRMATASPHTAEFFLARLPVGLQRTMFATLQRVASRLRYDQAA